MGRRLRVFVSSTMKDLANERDLVVRRLRASNIEPVHAESFLPTGGIWDRIQEEIAQTDVFLLILGESYGFVPEGESKSVTHLEYDAARSLEMPILAFLQELSHGTAIENEMTELRESVRSYSGGQLVQDFRLASDLSEKAGQAVVELLTRHFLRSRLETRYRWVSEQAARRDGPRQDHAQPGMSAEDLPADLRQAVQEGTALLVAGAGLSREAGLPGRPVQQGILLRRLRDFQPDYGLDAWSSSYERLVEDLELVAGREELGRTMRSYFFADSAFTPAYSHRAALRQFGRILTTNYSTLFEDAMREIDDSRAVVVEPIGDRPQPDRALIKLLGTVVAADTMVITQNDRARCAGTWRDRYPWVVDWLRKHLVVVVANSMTDSALIELFDAALPSVRGYLVVPRPGPVLTKRIEHWGLRPIPGYAEQFFRALEPQQAARLPGP